MRRGRGQRAQSVLGKYKPDQDQGLERLSHMLHPHQVRGGLHAEDGGAHVRRGIGGVDGGSTILTSVCC